MKRVFFNVSNGEVVEPSEYLPAYYADVDGIGRVKEIAVCYSQANIDRYGDLWALKELLRDREAWTCYKWLLRSLKKFVIRNYFREFRDFEKELGPRFVYVPIRLR